VARGRGSRWGISLEPPDAGQVDALKDHGELGGGQLDPGVRDFGKVVPPSFQSRAPQTQSVTAPVQNLDAVRGSIGVHEQVTRSWVGVELGTDHVGEAVESQAEIDPATEPQLHARRDGQHGRPSMAWTTAAITSGRVSAGSRRTVPDGSNSSIGGPAGDGVRR